MNLSSEAPRVQSSDSHVQPRVSNERVGTSLSIRRALHRLESEPTPRDFLDKMGRDLTFVARTSPSVAEKRNSFADAGEALRQLSSALRF